MDNRAYKDLAAAAAALGASVTIDEPMARHTTFRIGGPADLFTIAADFETLQALADLAHERGVPATVLGGGSNILVSDAGIRGLVIGNSYREISLPGAAEHGPAATGTPAEPGQVVAGSGAPLAGLARSAIRSGLAGLEWAVSVPGTVGGAVIGNAGAHSGQVADNLAWVLVATPGLERRTYGPEELGFAYRSSLLKQQLAVTHRSQSTPVVLQVAFRLTPGDAELLSAQAESYLARRRASQPVEPSAGSIFRNPPGDYAGRLVEAAGLKGYCMGGAQISPRHANFVVNAGGARAVEVRSLIELAQARVQEQFGLALIPEILFVGDWDPCDAARR